MKLYGGIDLHSTNSYVAVVSEDSKKLLCRKLSNDKEKLILALAPYKEKIEGVATDDWPPAGGCFCRSAEKLSAL